jgi:hypothetical protein
MRVVVQRPRAYGVGRPIPAPVTGYPVLSSARFAYFGDSLKTALYGVPQPFAWANGKAGAPLQLITTSSVAGNTIGQGLARVNNLWTDSTAPGLAGLSPLGAVVCGIGTNNTRGGNVINAQAKADYAALFAAILNYAEVCIVEDVPPIGSPENGAGVNSYNAWLDDYCAGNSRLIRANNTATVNNGSGGWATGYAPADGIHYSSKQALAMGLDEYTSLAPFFAAQALSLPLSSDPADVYPAQPQWVTNHLMSGTSGTNSIGSGQVASGWSIASYGGGYAATASIAAADVGDSNQTPWQVINPTSINPGSGSALYFNAALSGPSITTIYPDRLEVVVEVKFTGFAGARFNGLRLYVYGSANEEIAPQLRIGTGISDFTQTLVARSALVRPPDQPSPALPVRKNHPSAVLRFWLEGQGSAAFTGSMGSIAVRCATVRVLA